MANLTLRERLQTMDTFIAHWTAVNAELAPGALVLSGGYTLAGGFVPDREAVKQSMAQIVERENALSIARSVRDQLRNSLSARFSQFRAALNAFLPDTTYLISIPKKPFPASAAGEWADACAEMSFLWQRIDTNVPPVAGFVPPLVLAGGYARAQFAADADAMLDAYETVSERQIEMQLSRGHRGVVFSGPKARMVQYRLAVLATLDGGHPLILTLPAVSP